MDSDKIAGRPEAGSLPSSGPPPDLDFLPDFDSSAPLPSWLDVGVAESAVVAPADLAPEISPAPVPAAAPPPAPPPVEPDPPVLEVPLHSATVAVPVAMQEVSYGIVAGNKTTRAVFDCRVEHEVPPDLCYLGATPEPTVEGDRLVWRLGNLEPGVQNPVTVRARPRSPDGNPTPLTAQFFAYSTQQAVFQTVVFRPRLHLELTAPKETLQGDVSVFLLRIANRGNTAATEMLLHLRSTAGLRMASSSLADAALGTLAPDQSLEIPLPGIGIEPGTQSLEVTIEAAGSAPATASAAVVVTAPALVLRLLPPAHLTPGLVASFRIELANEGTAPALSPEVAVDLPEGMVRGSTESDVAADPSPPPRFATEFLQPGDSRVWEFPLSALYPGDFPLRVKAEADGGARTESTAVVRADLTNEGDILRALLADIDRQMVRGSSSAALLPVAREQPTSEHLVFAIAGTYFAVPVPLIEEVDRPATITPVPNVPPWVLGVVNLRGEIVSVVSLAAFLGLSPSPFTADTRLVLSRTASDELQIGLIVDRIRGILALRSGEATPLASSWEGGLRPYLRGVIESQDERVVLLDLEQLLLSPAMSLAEFS